MYLTKCPHSLEVRPITVYGFFLAVLFKSMYIVTELWNYLVQGRLSRVESNTTDRDAGKSQGGRGLSVRQPAVVHKHQSQRDHGYS